LVLDKGTDALKLAESYGSLLLCLLICVTCGLLAF